MDWIKQQEPSICCLQEMYLASKDSKKLNIKRLKNIARQMETVYKQTQLPYMGQSKLQTKASQRDKEIRCCHINEGNISLRGYNTCKYLASLGYILTPTPIWDGMGGSGASVCRELVSGEVFIYVGKQELV